MKHACNSQELVQVGIYRRVSTLEQAEGGYSLEDQERACREYLDRVYGPTGYAARVFSDEGFSGKLGFARPGTSLKRVRPGLSALVEAIANSEVSVVMIYRLDRLSRNARAFLEFLQDYVIEHDISLISVQDSIDGRTPMGRFAAGVLALAAELFSDQTSENVREALKRRRQDGYPLGALGCGWERDWKEEADE